MVEDTLQDILGPGVATGSADPDQLHQIWPEEAPAIAKAIAKRRQEFSAGRAAAREALKKLGHLPQAIPQGPQRAPQWPAGITGSISHCQGHALAAVAPLSNCLSLGIDVEPATPLKPELWRMICTPQERLWLNSLPPEAQGLMGKVIFSAKEAVYKAQYPLTGQVIGFDEVELDIDEAAQGFEIEYKTLNRLNLAKSGQFQIIDGVILSAVRLS